MTSDSVKNYLKQQHWWGLVVFLVILLLWDRTRLIADVNRKDSRIDKIVDDYHSSQITISEILKSLKTTLIELRRD